MTKPSSERVLLGEFGRAVGLRGEVRLKSLTDDPVAIADYGPLLTEAGKSYTILDGRFVGENMLVVKLAEVTTREGAEALNRQKVYVPRDALPAPEEDEFYHIDLIGLPAFDESGAEIGVVQSIFDHGSGDFLDIKQTAGACSPYLSPAPMCRSWM